MKIGMSYSEDMLRMVMLSMLSMKAVSCTVWKWWLVFHSKVIQK